MTMVPNNRLNIIDGRNIIAYISWYSAIPFPSGKELSTILIQSAKHQIRPGMMQRQHPPHTAIPSPEDMRALPQPGRIRTKMILAIPPTM